MSAATDLATALWSARTEGGVIPREAAEGLVSVETRPNHYFESPVEVAVFADQNASIESEFAFRFARDLPPRKTSYDRDEVLNAVAAVFPARPFDKSLCTHIQVENPSARQNVRCGSYSEVRDDAGNVGSWR